MSEEPSYRAYAINRTTVSIEKKGTPYSLIFKFTKSALEELGCNVKTLTLGLHSRGEIAKFVALVQTHPDYRCMRINNKFLVYTKEELNIVPSTPQKEIPAAESLEAALDTDGEDSELLMLDPTVHPADAEKSPEKTSTKQRTRTRIISREEVLRESY